MIGFNSNLPTIFVSSATGANTTGNLGIATITPGSKLQVNGNVAIGYSSATISPTNGLAISGNLGVGTNSPITKLQVNGNTAIGYTAAPANGLAVSGNVGIGITNPIPKLQVNGNIAIGYSTSLTYMPTNGAIIKGDLGVGVSNNHAPFGKVEIVQTNTLVPAITMNVQHDAKVSILRITTNQLTGNPNVNPYPYLELLQISTGSQFISGTYPSNPHSIDFNLSNNTTLLITGGGLMVGYNDDLGGLNNMPYQYAPSDGMMVKGNVGIGMNPTHPLSVGGVIKGLGGLYLGVVNNGVSSFILGSHGSFINPNGIYYGYNNNQEYNLFSTECTSFNFVKPNSETEQYLFTITADGNVGINQPNPQATLHIVEDDFDADPTKCKTALRIDAGPANDRHTHFLIKSNGFVYAREINVLLGTIPPPDYVFASEYQLKPLEEVEKFISDNNHLPEVPSGSEMTENGVDLGEMNMILLKKVEELTLHIIELNKRMKVLEEKRKP